MIYGQWISQCSELTEILNSAIFTLYNDIAWETEYQEL